MTLTIQEMMKSGAKQLPTSASVMAAVGPASKSVVATMVPASRSVAAAVRPAGSSVASAMRQGGSMAASMAQSRLASKRPKRSKASRASRVLRSKAGLAGLAALGGLAGGAALMYWFDPERGRSRRTRIASHSQAVVRNTARRAGSETSRHAHHLGGRLKGAAMKASGHGRYHPESDVDLREHLRQVIRSLPIPTSDVNVDVCAGWASLRGQVERPEHQASIRAAVAKTPGVEGIHDFLHLPGTPAPNKVAVLSLANHNGQVGA